MKISIIISLLAIVIASLTVSAQQSASDTRYFDLAGQADSAIAAGEYQKASQLLAEAISLKPGDPSNVLLMSNLGIVKQRMGDPQGAIEVLTAANVIAPSSVTVLNNRARVYLAIGEKDAAIRDYERVMQLDSTLVEPYFYRGMLAITKGDIVQADMDFAKMKRIDPDNELTKVANATVCTLTGRHEEGALLYRQLIAIDPSAEFYNGLIENLLALDDLQLTSDTVNEAIGLFPSDPDFYLYRAIVNKRRYMNEDARADARRALELGANPDVVKSILD